MRESLGRDSLDFASIQPSRSASQALSAQNFFTGVNSALSRAARRDCARALRARAHLLVARAENCEMSKSPYFIDVFGESRKSCACAHCLTRACNASQRVARASASARCWCRLRAVHASLCENAVFFVAAVVIGVQCSRSPRALFRHRHSLMARRAAWRRSERRRRSQRRKRARRRPSAGRRSKHAALHSLRLRTMSMTASNGPADVEER